MSIRWVVAALLALLPLGTAQADPVGMACHLTGKPEFHTAAKADWKPLRLLQKLEPGDRVRCGAGAEAILVLFASGERFQVSAGQEAGVQAGKVEGARSLGGLQGPSAQVVKTLSGARAGAFLSRDPQSPSRLSRTFPGWIVEGDRTVAWDAVPDAASYSFTLFDLHENVLWSQRVAVPNAVAPADLPAPDLRKSYLWRLTAFGKSGKPLNDARWGVLTYLSRSDADQLEREAKDLQQQAKESPDDPTPLSLLAERYRENGVLMKTLEILEDLKQRGEPGAQEALEDTYRQLGRYAQMLAGLLAPKDTTTGEGAATP